ncbi:hypothetical protein ACG7TL_002211 [Trametes sanguinea]
MVHARKSQRTKSPILALPPEIWIKIFALAAMQEDRWGFRDISAPLYNARQLLPLMLTCRSWRTLILRTPTLWSTFVDSGRGRRDPPYTRYLSRSGTAPIHLVLNGRLSQATKDLFDDHDPAFRLRLQSLACVFGTMSHSDYVSFLASSFPNLEECVIYFSSRTWGDIPFTSPSAFLPHSTRLRVLSLMSLTGHLPSAAFPELRELRVEASYASSLASKYASLLSFLSRTPQLRKLALSGLAEPSPVDYPRVSRVSLAHLCELTLHQDTETRARGSAMLIGIGEFSQHILRDLAIPSSCAFSLTPADVSHCRALAGLFPNESPADTLVLTGPVDRLDRLTIDLSLYNGATHRLNFDFLFHDASTPYTHTAVSWETSESLAKTCETLRAALHDLAIFSGVQRLRVVAYATVTLLQPSSVLAALPRLRALLVEDADFVADFGCPAGALLDALRPAQPGMATGGDSSVPCPLLRTLIVLCAGDDADAAPLQESIVQTLEARSAASVPIERSLLLDSASSDDAGAQEGEGGTVLAMWLEEYDAAGRTLLRTVRGGWEARNAVEAEWERSLEANCE